MSLAHLVLALEVVLPLLLQYYLETWQDDGRGSSGGSHSASSRSDLTASDVTGSRAWSSAASSPCGSPAFGGSDQGGSSGRDRGSGSSSDGSLCSQQSELPATPAPQLQLEGQQLLPPQRQQPAPVNAAPPLRLPPLAILLFGLGLSGVLYDVLLTTYTQWPHLFAP